MAIAPTALQTRPSLSAVDAHAPDEELVEQLRAGDETAFRVLVARHRPWLVRLGTRLLDNDAHAAEDLAQETLLKLHATVHRDRRPIRVRPWLAVVARHASLDEHRKRRPELPGELPEPATTNDGFFDLDPSLSTAWSALGGRHREVVYLREVLGFSYREIASVMDLSNSAVETLLFRARAALRREYERAGGSRFGCGVLGLGLYRFAGGDLRDGVGAHVAGCDACRGAVDAMRDVGSLSSAPHLSPGTAPAGHGVRMGNLAAGADLPSVPSSMWATLAGGEPILTKLFSAGAALVATVIPALVTGSLATPPTRPPAQSAAPAPAGERWAAPVPAGMMTTAAGAAAARWTGVPVAHTPASSRVRSTSGYGAEGSDAARMPVDVASGDVPADQPDAGGRLAQHRVVAPDLGSTPEARQPLRERRGTRAGVREELRSAGLGDGTGILRPQPVRDEPGRERLGGLLTTELPVVDPVVPVLDPRVPVEGPMVGAAPDDEPAETVPEADDGLEEPDQRPALPAPVPSRTGTPAKERSPIPAPPPWWAMVVTEDGPETP